jgi:hypothetical protein
MQVIYDDRAATPAFVREISGAEHFGAVPRRRRTLGAIMAATVEDAGLPPMIWWRSGERPALDEHTEGMVLIIPAWCFPAEGVSLWGAILPMLARALGPLSVPVDGEGQVAAMHLLPKGVVVRYMDAGEKASLEAILLKARVQLEDVAGKWPLFDLRDHSSFMKLVTSNFDTRHFNSIDYEDEFTIVKRSKDVEKLRAEYDFHEHVPTSIRHYFVQPHGFAEDNNVASYKMERLLFPDMATQWIHGGLSVEDLRALMDRLSAYLGARPRRLVDRADGQALADKMFLDKVRARIAALKEQPKGAEVDAFLRVAHGGIDAVFERYERLYLANKSRMACSELAFTHGDLCFSNILFDRKTRLVRFIDPRGVAEGGDGFGHPLYDLAKLSHSILGHYDFINNGLFGVVVSEDLALELVLDRVDPLSCHQSVFLALLAREGWDVSVVRLAEASLFLSMLPLHMDLPRKVLALALRGIAILSELEASGQLS